MKFKFVGISEKIYYLSAQGNETQTAADCYNDLEKEARQSHMQKVVCRDNRIVFAGPPFRYVWNGFNILNNVTSGYFEFSEQNKSQYIRYNVFFWELIFLHLLFSTIPFLGMFPNIGYRVLAFVVVWLLYIINVMITGIFIEKKLKKIIRKNGAVPVE